MTMLKNEGFGNNAESISSSQWMTILSQSQMQKKTIKIRHEWDTGSPSGKKETIRMIENFRGRTDKGMTFIYYSYFNAPEYPNRFIYKRDANNPNRYYYLPLDYSAVSLGGGVCEQTFTF